MINIHYYLYKMYNHSLVLSIFDIVMMSLRNTLIYIINTLNLMSILSILQLYPNIVYIVGMLFDNNLHHILNTLNLLSMSDIRECQYGIKCMLLLMICNTRSCMLRKLLDYFTHKLNSQQQNMVYIGMMLNLDNSQLNMLSMQMNHCRIYNLAQLMNIIDMMMNSRSMHLHI